MLQRAIKESDKEKILQSVNAMRNKRKIIIAENNLGAGSNKGVKTGQDL